MPINESGVMSVTPDDIKITRHLFDAFDEYNTEISAAWLVRFAQARGEGWKPFTTDQIETFYRKDTDFHNFSFNNLLSMRMILKDGDTYSFTEEFIARAYRSASRP